MKRTTKSINQSRPKAESILFSPLHCRAGLLRRKIILNMQNKPNFNHRHTKYDIRNTRLFMQYEPNFNRHWRNQIWLAPQLFTGSTFSPLARRTQLQFTHQLIYSYTHSLFHAKRTQFHHQRTNESRKRRRFHPHLSQKKHELFQKNPKKTRFL